MSSFHALAPGQSQLPVLHRRLVASMSARRPLDGSWRGVSVLGCSTEISTRAGCDSRLLLGQCAETCDEGHGVMDCVGVTVQ